MAKKALDPIQEALAVKRGLKALKDVDPSIRLQTAAAMGKDAKLAQAARASRSLPAVETRFRPLRPRFRVS